jgi:hypothetical protein
MHGVSWILSSALALVLGVVRLTGTIPTGAQRLEAAVVARAIPGVRAVQDDLRLGTTTP